MTFVGWKLIAASARKMAIATVLHLSWHIFARPAATAFYPASKPADEFIICS